MTNESKKMKRLRKLYRQEDLALVKEQGSTLCELAKEVAKKRAAVEVEEFFDYLTEEFGIPDEHAALIAANYEGKQPAEVCPISAIYGGDDVNPWNVLDWMGLKIEAIHPHHLLGWYLLKQVLN